MAEQKPSRSTATSVAGEVEAGLLSQLRVILDIYWISPVRNRLILMILGVVSIIIVTSAGQVLLNRWNVPFYDSLSRRDFPAFVDQLMVFFAIASVLGN